MATQIREDTWKILTQKQPQSQQQHIQEMLTAQEMIDHVTFVDTFPKVAKALGDEIRSIQKGSVRSAADFVKVLVNFVKKVAANTQMYDCSIDLDAYEEFKKLCSKETKTQSNDNERQVSPWVRNDQNSGDIIATDYQVHDTESTKRTRILGKVLKEVNYLTASPNTQQSQQQTLGPWQSSVAHFDYEGLLSNIFLSLYKIFKKPDGENNVQQVENISKQLLDDMNTSQTIAIPNIEQAAETAFEQTKNEEVDPDSENQAGNVQESNLKGAYLMWPANPPFFSKTTEDNIKYAESLIGSTVPQSNVFIYVPRAGGDGDFSSSCLDIYLHSKLGLSSGLKSKKGFAGITSVKTFILQIKNTIQKATENETEQNAQAQNQQDQSQKPAAVPALPADNSNTLRASTQMSTRERMLARLFEDGEGVKTVHGDSSSAQKTTATAVGSAATLQQSYENAIVIYATPRVRQDFEKFRKVFKQDLGLDLVLPDESHGNIMKDDKDALAGGKQVYQDILSFINGEKTGSAGAEDTKVAMTSAQSLSEAGPKPTQQPDSQDDTKEEKPDPAKGKWDWSYIKTNTAAKQVIQKIFADVELLKKGFDDGGNPNKMFLAAKAAATEYAKKWAAALGDGGDMMLEGVGMGWIVPAFKKGMEKLRSAEEEYQGIEAFVRSDKSNTLFSLLNDPDYYIEYGSETGGKS